VIQKPNHLASGVRWCTVSLKGVKVNLSPQVCKSDRFSIFMAAMVKFQQSVISEPDEVHRRSRAAIQQVCQHQLQQASLYSRHIMTSALHHE